MRTVGVAPGTTTIQLGGTCPPDPPWQYTTPPFRWMRPEAAAGPQAKTVEVFEPYGTESHMRGLGMTLPKIPLPRVDPQKTRWDLIGLLGGGLLLTAAVMGWAATRR